MGVWDPTGEHAVTLIDLLDEVYWASTEKGTMAHTAEILGGAANLVWSGIFLHYLGSSSVLGMMLRWLCQCLGHLFPSVLRY